VLLQSIAAEAKGSMSQALTSVIEEETGTEEQILQEWEKCKPQQKRVAKPV
jgi:hypothetical protein